MGITQEDINMVIYFWHKKEDIEKWIDWEKKRPEFEKEKPELVMAWDNYKLAVKTMDCFIDSLDTD